jgi:colanic acid/amylovoran biosynthesis glycosyltransferase
VRLAYLTSQYPAPSHTFIRREVDALARRGIHVHTLSVRPPAGYGDRDVAAARDTWSILPLRPAHLLVAHLWAVGRHPVRYVATWVQALRHRVPGLRALVWSFFYFAEAMVLARELTRRRIEHLHNHFANPGANVGYLATRYLRMGWSLTLHGISETDYPAGILLPQKIHAARFVACVSHFGRAQAMRMVEPNQWSKLHIVRCGVPTAAMRAGRRDEPSAPPRSTRVRVLNVGRLSPEKGQQGLLEAVAGAVACGVDVELRIAGDGPERGALEGAIAERGLGGRVVLLGRLDEGEVWEEMARADVFVLSSLMEGLPVVLMEAMAMGLPVIAPRVAGVPELVDEGRSGLLFDPADWKGLADRIRTLVGDARLRHRMGAWGQHRVGVEFDIDRAVEPLVEAFERCMPRAPVIHLPERARSCAASRPELLDAPDAVRQVGQLGGQVHDDEGDALVAAQSGSGGD